VRGGAFAAAFSEPVAIGILLGLVLGKPLGIVGTTWLVSRSSRVGLAPGLSWWDVLGVGAVAGIGFTVSLLVAELAFGLDTPGDDAAKVAILTSSIIAAVIGAAILLARGRHYLRAANGV